MALHRFVRLDGTVTRADDPMRGVWSGPCGYWTDDWTKLGRTGLGIPCCPACGAPGFQHDGEEWFGGAKRYELDGHPGYEAELLARKERCERTGAQNSA